MSGKKKFIYKYILYKYILYQSLLYMVFLRNGLGDFQRYAFEMQTCAGCAAKGRFPQKTAAPLDFVQRGGEVGGPWLNLLAPFYKCIFGQ